MPAERLEWDSDFFGFGIGRVLLDRLDAASAEAVEDWARKAGVRMVYFEASTDDRESVRAAETAGYALVDVRVVLDAPGRVSPEGAEITGTRAATVEDIPALESIAGDAFRDSRYYFDERFDREACSRLYRTWVRRSVEGYADAVWVFDLDGAVRGFITCHADADAGRIGLIGVADGCGGRGIGSALVARAVAWSAERGRKLVRVVTQGRNVGAQRLYQGAGFRTRAVRLFYHRWFQEEGP